MIALALLAAAAGSAGPIETGNDLLRVCSESDGSSTVECVTFLKGAVQGAQAATALTSTCLFDLPGGIEMSQVRDVAVQGIQAHPTIRHHSAALLTVGALAAAWPCKAR